MMCGTGVGGRGVIGRRRKQWSVCDVCVRVLKEWVSVEEWWHGRDGGGMGGSWVGCSSEQ